MSKLAKTATLNQAELLCKREELDTLRQELADNELLLATGKKDLLLFENRYRQVVGPKFAALDRLKARLLEFAAELDPEEFPQPVGHEQDASSHQKTEDPGAVESSEPQELPTEELKKLFREAAKRIHPDLTTDLKERDQRHELMAQLNQAYQEGDGDRIRFILEDNSEAGDPKLSLGAQLARCIRQIAQVRHRLHEIEAELERMHRSEMHRLKVYVESSEKQEVDVLGEMVAEAEGKIRTLKSRFKNLVTNCSSL